MRIRDMGLVIGCSGAMFAAGYFLGHQGSRSSRALEKALVSGSPEEVFETGADALEGHDALITALLSAHGSMRKQAGVSDENALAAIAALRHSSLLQEGLPFIANSAVCDPSPDVRAACVAVIEDVYRGPVAEAGKLLLLSGQKTEEDPELAAYKRAVGRRIVAETRTAPESQPNDGTGVPQR